MSKVITEAQFRQTLAEVLLDVSAEAVTGPGRSGAIAAVFASYLLRIPFVPYGQPFPGTLLVIDTVSQSGKTMRKASRQCIKLAPRIIPVSVFNQAERLHFWYEF